jgi:hypothetical protein
MKCYIISFDLKAYRNYDRFYDAIKSYGTWAKITESTWAIVTSQNTTQIRDLLMQHIDSDDRLFIIKSSGTSAWHNSITKIEWLKKYLLYK